MTQISTLELLKTKRKTLRKSATPQKIILWSRLRRNQLGIKFRRQHSIGNYILDFYCSEKKLAIELDGWQHKENKLYDNERTAFLHDLNIRVLRFWNNEINDNLEGVISKIIEALKP